MQYVTPIQISNKTLFIFVAAIFIFSIEMFLLITLGHFMRQKNTGLEIYIYVKVRLEPRVHYMCIFDISLFQISSY